jgi:hypothetical protein
MFFEKKRLCPLGHGFVCFLYFLIKKKIQMDQDAMSVFTILIF